MKPKSKFAVSFFLSGAWITASEFARNELLLKGAWTGHYSSMGLRFETLPINGALWLVWSFCLAFLVCKLLEKFTVTQAAALSWLAAFGMMWIVAFNLQVLPLGILALAVPLSLLEILVAIWIIKKAD